MTRILSLGDFDNYVEENSERLLNATSDLYCTLRNNFKILIIIADVIRKKAIHKQQSDNPQWKRQKEDDRLTSLQSNQHTNTAFQDKEPVPQKVKQSQQHKVKPKQSADNCT